MYPVVLPAVLHEQKRRERVGVAPQLVAERVRHLPQQLGQRRARPARVLPAQELQQPDAFLAPATLLCQLLHVRPDTVEKTMITKMGFEDGQFCSSQKKLKQCDSGGH